MLLIRFFLFYLKSRTIHHVHSPSLYKFAQATLQNNVPKEQVRQSTRLRHHWLNTHLELDYEDLGGTSRRSKKIVLSKRAKIIGTTPRKGKILHNIATWSQAKNILELGTGFGLSTSYLAEALPSAQILSIDGNHRLNQLTRVKLQELYGDRITVSDAKFETALLEMAGTETRYDLVLIDGDHRSSALRQNVEQILPLLNDRAVIVFDDIYWSADTKMFWEEFRTKILRGATVDLFDYGIYFHDRNFVQATHYNLVKESWKPFSFST